MISGKTKTLALIGSPVGHSGSPAMYNYCFEKLGDDCVYVAFDVNLDTLEDAMRGIKAMGFKGINITMPCKSAVIPYLDDISPAAKLMNACNVAVNEDGRWIGHNTDGMGFVNNLKAHGFEIAGKRLTILGAGGAGTAVAVQCALSGSTEIRIFNLKDAFYGRAEQTGRSISDAVTGCKVTVGDLEDEKLLEESIAASDFLINATRSGMAPNTEEMPLKSTTGFHRGLIVCDTVYNPRETKLILAAKDLGCRTVPGIGMLVQQGASAYKLFTGKEMPVEEVTQRFFS